MMGNGEPVLTQSVGPRMRTVAIAAQTAQYSDSRCTLQAQDASAGTYPRPP
jgi:hypothetical protein